MKWTCKLIALLLLSLKMNAQVPTILWEKALGGSGYDGGLVVLQSFDGNFVVGGNSASSDGNVTANNGATDCWVLKLSATGSILWQKNFGGSGADYLSNIIQTKDSGFILTAYTRSANMDVDSNRGLFDAWIVKLSAAGNIQWKKTYGGSGNDIPLSIRQTFDGGYIVGAWSSSNDGNVTSNKGNEDVWIIKLNDTGKIEWQKSYGGSDEDHATAIVQTSDSGYVFSGYVRSNDFDVSGNHGQNDFWVVKLNKTGSIVWQKCYGGSGVDANGDHAFAGCLQQTKDGGLIVSGWSNSTNGNVTGNHGDFDGWILKLNDTGKILWQKSLGDTGDDEATSITQTTDGGYLISLLSNSTSSNVTGNHGLYDFWIVKLDSVGNTSWQQCFGGNGKEVPFSITPTKDTNCIIAGYTYQSWTGQVTNAHADYDMWVVKLKLPPIINSVLHVENNIALQLIPNPTNGIVTITGTDQYISAKVYNATGQQVKDVLHSHTFDLSELPSGVYVIEIFDARNLLLSRQKLVKQ